jgi:uncharacterized protein
VMKHSFFPNSILLQPLVMLLVFSFCVVAGPQNMPPRPDGSIADFANVIDDNTKQQITLIAQSLWEQAGFGLVVATFPTIGSEPIEDFSVNLYKSWGIGKKGVDEGALVILSLDPRKVRIEIGYGAEGYLNDAKTGRILDTYGMPYLKAGNYSLGMLNTVAAIAEAVGAEKNITLTAIPAVTRQTGNSRGSDLSRRISPVHVIIFIIVLIIMLSTRTGRTILWMLILSSLLGGGRHGNSSGGFGGGFGGGGFGGGMSGGGGASRGF